MVTTRVVRRRPAADNRNARVDMFYQPISGIAPYPQNPRDNASAISSVANSIKAFGFIIPVVIDRNGVLAAGHTRIEAAKVLHLQEVPAIRAEHLTEDQINAFRLIDNKVAEIAKWDFDMLSGEVQKLTDTGLDFTEFGWSREEIDCLSSMVSEDCLSAEGLVDAESRDRITRSERRAPNTARYVLGELVFFIPATTYREWVTQLREDCNYDELAIVREIKTRLGIPDHE